MNLESFVPGFWNEYLRLIIESSLNNFDVSICLLSPTNKWSNCDFLIISINYNTPFIGWAEIKEMPIVLLYKSIKKN